MSGDGGSRTRSSSVQARRSATRASSPGRECGRVESNHHSQRRRGYSPLSSPVLSVREKGDRPDSNRHREDHDLACCRYTTATTNGDGRTRTGGPSPDKRALWPLSYAPMDSCAGGIRTHGLELMRLARTAAPLPRCVQRSGRQESNLRSPAPEAGGVASPPQPDECEQGPPAGLEPALPG